MTPNWPAPVHVKAVFTTRHGGVSVASFGTLNLGDHVGDRAEHVAINRKHLAQEIGAQPIYLKQVHGTDVVILDANTPDGTVADACITTHRDVACTIMWQTACRCCSPIWMAPLSLQRTEGGVVWRQVCCSTHLTKYI